MYGMASKLSLHAAMPCRTPHYGLTTSPRAMTKSTVLRTVTSVSGSPSTAMMSALLPGRRARRHQCGERRSRQKIAQFRSPEFQIGAQLRRRTTPRNPAGAGISWLESGA